MTGSSTPEPASASVAGDSSSEQLPAARESTDYLAGFSDGYRAACAANGVFDDAVTALAEQNPRQALEVRAARQAASAARGAEKTPAQLRADAFASWGLTDDRPTTATTSSADTEEFGP